jgi:hypothetical protein
MIDPSGKPRFNIARTIGPNPPMGSTLIPAPVQNPAPAQPQAQPIPAPVPISPQKPREEEEKKRDFVCWPTRTAFDRQVVEIDVPFIRKGERLVLHRRENGAIYSVNLGPAPKKQ